VALAGHTILIVEDEPLIALAIVEDFTAAGASVHTAYNLCDRLRLADHPDLSAAVVDFGLSDGKGSALCERLNERQVPFVLHTGYTHVHEACQSGIVVPKACRGGAVGERDRKAPPRRIRCAEVQRQQAIAYERRRVPGWVTDSLSPEFPSPSIGVRTSLYSGHGTMQPPQWRLVPGPDSCSAASHVERIEKVHAGSALLPGWDQRAIGRDASMEGWPCCDRVSSTPLSPATADRATSRM
jgi:CheY-like chemotaxis protein